MASTRGHNHQHRGHISIENSTTGKLFLIFLVILSASAINQCQSSVSPSPSSPSLDSGRLANSSDDASVATTIAPDRATNSSSSSQNITTVVDNPKSVETLLSASEFVDLTEAPTLLFDGTSNDNENDTTSTESSPTPTPTTLATPSTSSATTISPPPTPTTVTTVEVDVSNRTSENIGITTTTVASVIDGGDDSGEDAASEGDANGGDQLTTTTKEPFEPPKNVSQYMDYIETLFHDLRHQLSDLFEPHLPQLIRSSQMVQLSGSCSYDMLRMALALRQFEPWALRMIDSSGKVPEGIFEGSFTALGSYDECLNTVFGQQETSSTPTTTTTTTKSSEDNNNQQNQTQGKYCLVNVSPYLPPKPPADRVERMFQEEANRRNYTQDNQFSRLSPMFYYMKFRIGICIPSTCTESDMDSLSEALSTSLRLNITIPNCRVRQYQPLTNHQLAGGLVFASVLALVFGATLMDYSKRKFDQQKRQVLMSVANNHHHHQLSGEVAAQQPGSQVDKNNKEIRNDHDDDDHYDDDDDDNGSIEGPTRRRRFYERLSKNWSWLSFSLITNYKIYFSSSSCSSLRSKKQTTTVNSRHDSNRSNGQDSGGNEQIIKCLNGIRVISLCWVIVANSYITLDPRATKRLTKTREAPKDFFFQMVAQASLAIETFFFLSGVLMSLSFIRKFRPEVGSNQPAEPILPQQQDSKLSSSSSSSNEKKKQQEQQHLQERNQFCLSHTKWRWIQFYIHRYIRMTPATMLVIAFTMYAYGYGDGPLWFEATHKAHQSCSENWWRHLLHIANFIDTRQMCFIHYWYIAADMQLFLFAPLLLLILYKYRKIGHALVLLIGASSIGSIFYTTYARNLPPTLLFYNSDPESRREFGNTIMTKPLTHALPYLVGMLVGKWLSSLSSMPMTISKSSGQKSLNSQSSNSSSSRPLTTLFGGIATVVALAEVFLPYKWNNSHLPTRLLASLYAAFFRFAWSLVLAYIIMSCRHKKGRRCTTTTTSMAGTVNDQPSCLDGRRRRRSFTTSSSESTSESSLSSSTSSSPTLSSLVVKMAPSSTTKCASCQSLNTNIIDGSQTTLIGRRKAAAVVISANGASSRYDDNIIISSSSASAAATAIKQTTAQHNRAINLRRDDNVEVEWCLCGNGGNLVNRLLSLDVFTYLSKLSFVAYLIHLPLMSVFIAQTRGLFAFSHTLVIHLALSYLVMTFILSFILVHLIELPFLTFERYLFEKFLSSKLLLKQQQHSSSAYPTDNHLHHHRKDRCMVNNNHGNNIMSDGNNCAGIHIVEPSKSFHVLNQRSNNKNRYSINHQGNSSPGEIMISVSEKL